MKGSAKCYDALREYFETVPLVDCHDHTTESAPKYEDPISALVGGYFTSDMISASSMKDMERMNDASVSLARRWPLFKKTWDRTCHTGYARVTRLVLKKFYGEDKLTLAALKRMKGKLLDLSDNKEFDRILGEANIAVRLENVHYDPKSVLDGTAKLAPRSKLVIGIPGFHNFKTSAEVEELTSALDCNVTSLDEYLDACLKIFKGYKKFGAVAFKDQSAYTRTLSYDNPPRAEAEKVFNWIMEDPRRSAGYPDQTRPMDDYLFHCFMRMARDLNLPVQIHTGHMAGIRNDIAKTNAVGLTRLIELHRDARFDLFHANWPYSGEVLYLCKNYPNVTIDFCWANIIDPVYCQNMFKQALSSVPHGKIHGYGSDFGGSADRAWAHAAIARDNIAIALSDMVEIQYLDLDEAKEVGRAWLFDNANKFFNLKQTCDV